MVVGGVGWVNPLIKQNQKENLWKSLFTDSVEWSSKKLWKMTSADVKTIRNKTPGDCVIKQFIRSTFKTWKEM